MAVGVGKCNHSLAVCGHDALKRIIHDIGDLVAAFLFAKRDLSGDPGLGNGVVDCFPSGFDHDGGDLIGFCKHDGGVSADDGAVSVCNRLLDHLIQPGLVQDRIAGDLDVRIDGLCMFGPVYHVESAHDGNFPDRCELQAGVDGGDDVISGHLQLRADDPLFLHAVGGEAPGDGHIRVDIIQRIVEKILYDFVLKFLPVRPL